MSKQLFRILSALSCIAGNIMLSVSFAINPGPPNNPTSAQLIAFGEQYATSIFVGAWLQAVSPLFIVMFACALVCLADATNRLSGWMTMFGSVILVMVSLIEVSFYLSAFAPNPSSMGLISLDLIHAIQHLYFIIAAPALFLPLGVVILSSRVLPRVFAYLAFLLGTAFAILGVVYLSALTLPLFVQAFAGVQTLWWLGAAITLLVLTRKKAATNAVKEQEPALDL
ncbi:MAG TPA: hypothetical protein VGD98_17510, partial [Ktedonobacteraceae bacterium]